MRNGPTALGFVNRMFCLAYEFVWIMKLKPVRILGMYRYQTLYYNSIIQLLATKQNENIETIFFSNTRRLQGKMTTILCSLFRW